MEQKPIALAHCILAVRDIGECLADLGEVIQQGITETNALNRGNIASGLERAAYRIRYGTSEGFELNTAKPVEKPKVPDDYLLPPPFMPTIPAHLTNWIDPVIELDLKYRGLDL